MSEEYDHCYFCGKAIRIGLDDDNDEYAWCGCDISKAPSSHNAEEVSYE